MSDYRIPPDWVDHKDIVFAQNQVPFMWHRTADLLNLLKARGITGKGLKIGVVDTGYDVNHPYLPKPTAVRNFTNSGGSGSVTDRQGHGCIAPTDLIYTSNCGLQEIQTFFDRMSGVAYFTEDGATIKDISRYNIKTFSLDKDGNTVPSKITHVHKLRHNGKVFKVKTSVGELTLTPWHPVYILKSSTGKHRRIIKVRADELKINDKILLASESSDIAEIAKIPYKYRYICSHCNYEAREGDRLQCKSCNKTKWHSGLYNEMLELNDDLAYFIGLILSDGHLRKNEAGIEFVQIDNEIGNKIADEFINLSKKIFGYEPKKYEEKRGNCNRYLIYNKDIYDFLVSIGCPVGNKSKTLIIPEIVAKSPRSVIFSFLGGLLEGDGCLDNKIRLATGSKDFAYQLKYLLSSLGVRAYASYQKQTCKLSKNPDIVCDMYYVGISGNDYIKNKIRVKDTSKINPTRNKSTAGILSIIEEDYDGDMYDFTVDTYHNYVANGHIVSNTHVAGMIVGKEGIGLLPEAEVFIAKGLGDDGSGSTTWLNNGLKWLADQGCHFINGSYGGPGGGSEDLAVLDYCYEKGVWLLHFAAGNAGYNGSRNSIGYPARYNRGSCNGSYDANGNRSSFSSGGAELQLLGAGGQVVSTVPGTRMFAAMSGTSMGSPDVTAKTGAIAIARRMAGLPDIVGYKAWDAFYKDLLEKKLLKDGHTPGRDTYWGYGQLLTEAIIDFIKDPVGA